MYDTSGAIRRNRFYMGDGWKRYVQLLEGGEEKLAIPGDRVDESGTYVALFIALITHLTMARLHLEFVLLLIIEVVKS